MSAATDYAFENPVTLLHHPLLIRTASQAVEIVRSNLRRRFTMHGLNTVLMLERALAGDEVEEARVAFCAWAVQEGLA
jgi:hypothetical protein